MSKLLIDEPPLQVLPSLAARIGLNEAIFLQQLHYWLGRSTNEQDGRLWTYGAYKDWLPQFPFWSLVTIKRTIRRLEKLGLVLSKQPQKTKWLRKKWYTIDYRAFARMEAGAVQTDLFEGIKLTPSKGSKRSARRDQIDLFERVNLIPSHKEAETTHEISSETTHTQKLVSVGSRFTKEECLGYARHLHTTGQGIQNPEGFARSIFRSGEEDSEIAAWLDSDQACDPLSPYNQVVRCPSCNRTEPCAEDLCDFPVEKLRKEA